MNARQTAKDMVRKALDERTPEKERVATAFKALAFISKNELLDPIGGGETVKTVAQAVDRFTDPDFVKGAADRVEGIESGAERIAGSLEKLAKRGGGVPRRSGGRRYGGR